MREGLTPPPLPPRRRKRTALRRAAPLALVVVLAAMVGVYALVDPAEADYFPRCTMKMLTGWECPGCGVQRAIHELLNGRVAAAFVLNPFLFVVAPYLLALVVCSVAKQGPLRGAYLRLTSATACYIYLAAYAGWWVLRNLI